MAKPRIGSRLWTGMAWRLWPASAIGFNWTFAHRRASAGWRRRCGMPGPSCGVICKNGLFATARRVAGRGEFPYRSTSRDPSRSGTVAVELDFVDQAASAGDSSTTMAS